MRTGSNQEDRTVIPFAAASRPSRRQERGESREAATILLFTGVRYQRPDRDVAAPDANPASHRI